jgi:hypothetical protein
MPIFPAPAPLPLPASRRCGRPIRAPAKAHGWVPVTRRRSSTSFTLRGPPSSAAGPGRRASRSAAWPSAWDCPAWTPLATVGKLRSAGECRRPEPSTSPGMDQRCTRERCGFGAPGNGRSRQSPRSGAVRGGFARRADPGPVPRFWPARPARARVRRASVAGKSGAAPNCCRRVAQQPALQGRSERGQPGHVDRRGPEDRRGAAAAAHRAARQKQLRTQAGQFRLPPGLLVAGQRGHLGQMLAQARIPALQQRQQLVADAVAGEGEVAIRGVLAPALAQRAQIGSTSARVVPSSGRRMRPSGKLDHWMNAAQSPRSRRRAGIWPAPSRPGRRGCGRWPPHRPRPRPSVAGTSRSAGGARPPRWFRRPCPTPDWPGRALRRRYRRAPRERAGRAAAASSRANSRSASASAPRRPWCRWAACSTRPVPCRARPGRAAGPPSPRRRRGQRPAQPGLEQRRIDRERRGQVSAHQAKIIRRRRRRLARK